MTDLAAGIKRELAADSVSVDPIDGGVRVEAVRGTQRAKLDVYPDHVNWVTLQSTGARSKWMRDAHRMAREYLPTLGVKYLMADPGTPEARATLKRYGDWKDTDNARMRWELT